MLIQQVVGSTFIPVLVFRLQKNHFVLLEVSHWWKFGQTQEVVSSTFNSRSGQLYFYNCTRIQTA